MAANRIEILKAMLERNPADTFAAYALAQEFANSGQLDAAVEQYRQVIASNADYAAAYYHGGQAFEKLDRIEEAREMYEKGIEVTRRTGDGHTRSELEAALSMLPV
jgi:tetratricopeptide (TPR) repeat protein